MSAAAKNAEYFAALRARKGSARLEPAQRPLAQFITTFLSDKQAEGTSPGYRRELERTVERFAAFLAGGLERPPLLADLTIEAVRAFILSEQQRPRWLGHPKMAPDGKLLSAQMIQNEVRMLKVFASWLESEEFTHDERGQVANLLRRLKLPKAEKKELQPLTPDEETKLMKACDDRTHPGCRRLALVMLYLDTGCRLAEIAGLKQDDLHLEEGYLHVRWETAKGHKERSVPFGHKTERALKRYLTFYRDPATDEAEQYVFLDMEGYPITSHAIQEVVQRLAKRSGIPRLHPHLFRHSYATRMVEANVNTLYLQTLLGHTSSKTTERYVHVGTGEKLKRNRRLSHIDALGVKLR